MFSIGLLIVRLVVGLTMAGHGTQKLFGWFGGYGIKGTGGWMESVGIKPGPFMAFLAGLSETAGGLLFAAGILLPLAAVLIAVPMAVATYKVHGKNGYWAAQNGFEYNLTLIAVAIAVAFTGPGSLVL